LATIEREGSLRFARIAPPLVCFTNAMRRCELNLDLESPRACAWIPLDAAVAV
jgi:hypothetical protein